MNDVPGMLRRGRALVALAVVGFVLFGAAATPAQVTDQDVDDARLELEEAESQREGALLEQQQAAEERARAVEDVDQAIEAYEAVNAEYQSLMHRNGLLRSRIESYESEVSQLEDSIRERAVEAYMHARERDQLAREFFTDGSGNVIIAREILDKAVEAEAAELAALAAATAEMERLREELRIDGERLVDLRIEAEALAARMYELLGEAEVTLAIAEEDLVVAEQEVSARSSELSGLEAALEEQRRIEEEAARRREAIALALTGDAAAGVSDDITPGFICPVAGATAFTDSWGAPRSGGRTHKGVDMMGARGTPLVAVGDGSITMSYGTLGGNIVWLHADHGVSYFYAHLDSYPPGLVSGQRVARGQVIGYMGDTGNPAPGAYHLHFGIYPGGASAVNPYPTVARHCP
jgi:murein DD-endopeptidase MepM/ murein hydrolase activator NlpD